MELAHEEAEVLAQEAEDFLAEDLCLAQEEIEEDLDIED